MTHETYTQIEAVNWSSLKWMRESALSYRHHLEVERADSDALAFGRLVHTLVFEPALVASEYAVWKGSKRQGKAWNTFQFDHDGKTIIKPDMLSAATACANAVRGNPLVAQYLQQSGIFEQPLVWVDNATGITCKARPDWVIPESRILIDLKTCQSIQGNKFGSVAARLGYHCQMAHYFNGVEKSLGWAPERVLLVAVEKEAPHDVGVFEIDSEALYAGSEEVRELLQRVQACKVTGEYPGRYCEEQALQLPAWVMGDDEDDANTVPDDLSLIFGE